MLLHCIMLPYLEPTCIYQNHWLYTTPSAISLHCIILTPIDAPIHPPDALRSVRKVPLRDIPPFYFTFDAHHNDKSKFVLFIIVSYELGGRVEWTGHYGRIEYATWPHLLLLINIHPLPPSEQLMRYGSEVPPLFSATPLMPNRLFLLYVYMYIP